MGKNTPFQRRCWRMRAMRANVPSPDQADVIALQQFVVDAYAKIESERLQFLRREQYHLRADNEPDLLETIFNQDGDLRNVGSRKAIFACYILRRPTLIV